MEICEITGLTKSVKIEYFLNGKSLGKTTVSESSFSASRIKEAKNLGIDYYDGFILDDGRSDSRTVKLSYNGVLLPMDDFKKCDEIEL